MTADMPRQLAFDLPHRPALGVEDFLVSASNGSAVDLIDRWPHWPHLSVVVVGPPGSGKSHLAHVWRLKSGADVAPAGALADATVTSFQDTSRVALVVEDVDRGIADERVLFHLLNQARETGRSVLLTSRRAPGDIDIKLPDLRSRLRALPVVSIGAPDEGLLTAVLIKLFCDRQLVVEPPTIQHIARHMDRSMEAALAVVAAIDALALVKQRKVTRALAAEALAALVPLSAQDGSEAP